MISGPTSKPSRFRIRENRSANVGWGWTNVSPASKKTASNLTGPMIATGPGSARAGSGSGDQVPPHALDLGLEVLERPLVVNQDVGRLRLGFQQQLRVDPSLDGLVPPCPDLASAARSGWPRAPTP